jgi:hypothetical protein
MEPQEYARHPFHEGAGKQSERLGRLSVNLSPRSGLPVLFYTREG